MNKKHIDSIRDFSYDRRFAKFFKGKSKVIEMANQAIQNNNSKNYPHSLSCNYNVFIGEDNVQIYSKDSLISFISIEDGKKHGCSGTFYNRDTNSFCQFLIEGSKTVPEDFVASYFISNSYSNNGCEQITRGKEFFEGENHTNIENIVIHKGSRVLCGASMIAQTGENTNKYESIICDGVFWAGTIDASIQPNFQKFRQELLSRPCSYEGKIDGEEVAMSTVVPEFNGIMRLYCNDLTGEDQSQN